MFGGAANRTSNKEMNVEYTGKAIYIWEQQI